MFNLLDGYTVPKTKTIEYKIEGKLPELHVAHYQSIDEEFRRCVSAVLEEYSVSPKRISRVRLVLGGNHGKGAFCLCFRLLISMDGMDKPIHKTTLITKVYCKKEKVLYLRKRLWIG